MYKTVAFLFELYLHKTYHFLLYAYLRNIVYKIWHVYVAGSMIGDLYRNGREFCEKRNYQCEPMESQNCFTFDSTLDKVSAAQKTFYVNVETSFLYFVLLILHTFVEVGGSIG